MTDSIQPPILHTDALPSGARLGEFELVRLLGVGGFGMVYEAYDHSLHRSVAIKEYMPTALAGRAGSVTVGIRSSLDGASYQAGLQSFVAEARLLAQFDHPSLVKVFRFWEANNTAYMVMPLYSGMTLKQARGQMRGPPSESWLRQVLWSVLQALQLLHDSHTVHRDVSPENIFLQDSGPPVLLDLGAARRAIGDLGLKHTAVLKVNYAPIEQYADVRDMAQGPWSDLYALAAVVHGCVADALPLPATFRVLRDRMPSMQAVAQAAQGQAYSSMFVGAIDQALAIRPEDRPQSVQAFVHALGLQPPAEMTQFDWRTEMGQGWQLTPQERARPETLDLAELPTHFVYPPRPSVGGHLEVVGTALVVSDKVHPRRPRVWALVALLALVAGAGTAVWRQSSEVSGLAETPASAPVLAALAPVPPVVTASVVAEPVVAPAAIPAETLPVSPPKKPVSAKERSTSSAPNPAGAAVSAHVAPPQRTALAGNVSVFLCTDNNFLTRPMCLYRECQKPEFAELEVCKENTQRLLAQQQKRR
ncbi:serine/threonine protein kinase [Rhodoferax sp.]|uniref:serine/threonine protein kinase n=1 Tax=Rhodoferax sp. TaxID=50421 RepID=UPI0025FAC49E|nr:serine/threonine protein kinase [Rhodoferax sp.]